MKAIQYRFRIKNVKQEVKEVFVPSPSPPDFDLLKWKISESENIPQTAFYIVSNKSKNKFRDLEPFQFLSPPQQKHKKKRFPVIQRELPGKWRRRHQVYRQGCDD